MSDPYVLLQSDMRIKLILDDLLDCPCIDMSPEERAGFTMDSADGDALGDDDGDDETSKGFAPASQYDADVSPRNLHKPMLMSESQADEKGDCGPCFERVIS